MCILIILLPLCPSILVWIESTNCQGLVDQSCFFERSPRTLFAYFLNHPNNLKHSRQQCIRKGKGSTKEREKREREVILFPRANFDCSRPISGNKSIRA